MGRCWSGFAGLDEVVFRSGLMLWLWVGVAVVVGCGGDGGGVVARFGIILGSGFWLRDGFCVVDVVGLV